MISRDCICNYILRENEIVVATIKLTTFTIFYKSICN